MIRIYSLLKIYLLLCLSLAGMVLFAQEYRQRVIGKPLATADLRTTAGTSLLKAAWFVQPAHLTEKPFFLPGPQKAGGDAYKLYPTGASIQTHSLHPQVGDTDFEKGFLPVSPEQLEDRQGTGLLSFAWYKLELTLPEQIGKLKTAGTTAVLEMTVDDYSEIWVNGKQATSFGQSGNGLISGYNTPHRVVLAGKTTPGEKFTVYILGINGPLGHLPENYIWIRNATVDFFTEGWHPDPAWANDGKIYRIDESLNDILAPGTKIEKLADGFSFTEGPVWHPDGYLLFSDPNTNTIYKYDPVTKAASVYISHSGYTGTDIGDYRQPGSNGLTIDREGRLLVAQHGNRRVIRHEKKGPVTILADNYNGKKLNSPNDLVLRSDGALYFTDPPYGLPGLFDDPAKETEHQGVYRVKDGRTVLLHSGLGGPNGIAFSPDERYLYVGNWDIRDIHHTKTVWRFEVMPDGTLDKGRVFFDWNLTEDEEAVDGIKVDKAGNLFVSAPGGVWVLSAAGKLLGKIVTPERAANMAWGDDGKSLYLTTHTGLHRVRVLTGGKFSWE